VLLAQDDHSGHVTIYQFVLSGSVLTITSNTDTSMSCSGNLGWLTNQTDGLAYVATTTGGRVINVYQVTSLARSKTYNVTTLAVSFTPDSLSGWTFPDGSGGVNVGVVIGVLSSVAQTSGPTYDPRNRVTEVFEVTSSNVSSGLRSQRGLIPVSRTFKIDDDWYSIVYYQGGPGLTHTPTVTPVTWTSGDQMKGPAVQPLTFSPGDYQYGNSVTLPNLPAGVSAIVASGGTTTYYLSAAAAMLALGPSYFDLVYQSGAHIHVTGASNSGNNGTFVIDSMHLSGSTGVIVNCTTTTQVTETASGSMVVTITPTDGTVSPNPDLRNTWVLTNLNAANTITADASWIGENLFVAGTSQGANGGANAITDVSIVAPRNFIKLGSSAALQPEVIPNPVQPTAVLELQLADSSTAYQFTLQSVTFDPSYVGAFISVQNSGNALDDTVYQIQEITGSHTVIATPVNGTTNQISIRFQNTVSIAISFPTTTNEGVQQTWFMVPVSTLLGTAVTGRWEYGIAYSDWRFDGQATPNLYPYALSSVTPNATGSQVLLPYRAESFSASVIAPSGNPVTSFVSTIGMKLFTIASKSGQSLTVAGELIIPGPMASEFTASGFAEQGINIGPELPFLVSQTNDGTIQLGLTPGTEYQVIAVFEVTDEDGDRIYSVPSPALNFFLQTGNNTATYGGSFAVPTNRILGISLYRTSIAGGVTTVQHYKITNDADPNGAGFTFPDSWTWNYKDQTPDATLPSSEVLYTDKGFLPRYPAPAFVQGVGTWRNRTWVLGYDDAIWMSGEKTPGDAVWFHPAFRYTLPTDDTPASLAALDDYMTIQAAQSHWYIPSAQFPDATGNNGTLPTPVQMPFANGGTGYAVTTRDGVIYSSTAGGVWIITRNLTNEWLSQAIQSSLPNTAIVNGIAVDKNQRVHVSISGGFVSLYVWDTVPGAWYIWNAPTEIDVLGSYQGQIVYADGAQIVRKTPGSYLDFDGTNTILYGPAAQLAPIHLMGSVRGYGRCWALQLQGDYMGPHTIQLTLGYGDERDYQPPTVFPPYAPSGALSYLYEWNPQEEEASQFELTLVAVSTDDTNGNTSTWELISFDVGVDQGIARLPAQKRISSG
jgi:hypothetical protein